MQSKKMWQTFAVTIIFLLLSSLAAWGVSRFSYRWEIFFGIGFGIMLLAIVPLFFYEKKPKATALTLFLNVISCGFLVGSYFLGSHTRLSLQTAVFSALASAASYLVLMLLTGIPVLRRSRVYIIVVYILWCAALFTTGGILWSEKGGESFAAFTLFSVVTALFALGSLLPSENTDELLLALAIPSSFAAGIIAVIVLLVLLQADDCSCDCCDGGDCADCCDCTPDYGRRKIKHTTMSELSGPNAKP